MGYIVSCNCSISFTVSRENTKNFIVKEKNTVYHFRTLFSEFKFLPLKMRYSPYVNKGFVYISVSKILIFIRQLFIFS